MKNIIIFALATVMLISCVACSNTPDNSTSTNHVEAEPQPSVTTSTDAISTEPAETESAETESAETESVETESVETESAETESAETESAETEPAETEPAETESAETEPAETEPVETEPVETEPVERIKPEIKVVTIDEYMTEKYGTYEFVRSEPWFDMFRIKNGTVSVFVYKHEELKYGINLAGVYDYMFTYNWADNGYWQVNADKIEAYYDNLMKPYLKDIGEYALFAYLEQAVMPSELTLDMSWEDALKEYGEFLFPQITIMVKNPLTDAQKTAIVDKLTADGVKVRLHIGTAPAEDFELHRNSVIPYIAEKYSNQMDVRINWNGDMPVEETPEGAATN